MGAVGSGGATCILAPSDRDGGVGMTDSLASDVPTMPILAMLPAGV